MPPQNNHPCCLQLHRVVLLFPIALLALLTVSASSSPTSLQYNPFVYTSRVTVLGGRDGNVHQLDACTTGGNTLRALDFCTNDQAIIGVRLVLSNGDSEVWGRMRCPTPSRIPIQRGERVRNLTLATNSKASVLCGIQLGTESNTFHITAPACREGTPPTVRVDVASGVPCGALGRATSTRLVAFGLYFLAQWQAPTLRLTNMRYSRPPSQPAGRALALQTWYVYGGTLNNTNSTDDADWESTVGNVWSGAVMLGDYALWESSGLLDYAAVYSVDRAPSVALQLVPQGGRLVSQGFVYADDGATQGPQQLRPWTRTTLDTCPAGCFCQLDYWVAQAQVYAYFRGFVGVPLLYNRGGGGAVAWFPSDGLLDVSATATRMLRNNSCGTSVQGGGVGGVQGQLGEEMEEGTLLQSSGNQPLNQLLDTVSLGSWWETLNATATSTMDVTESPSDQQLCPMLAYQFVCGADNVTYDNECVLTRANVQLASRGACVGYPVPTSAGQRARVAIIVLSVLGSLLLVLVLGILVWRRVFKGRAPGCASLQLCANPTYNPYQLHDNPNTQRAATLKNKGAPQGPSDMEANRQLSSSEGVEIAALHRLGDVQPLAPVRQPPGYSARRVGGPGKGYGAIMQEEGPVLRRRTSSRSFE